MVGARVGETGIGFGSGVSITVRWLEILLIGQTLPKWLDQGELNVSLSLMLKEIGLNLTGCPAHKHKTRIVGQETTGWLLVEAWTEGLAALELRCGL
ncbi:hypothetical protein Droror1_Dr00011749 [Drosera rotundifolia]